MKTIAIIAQKGGTGKTTTAHALGAGLARRGHRTLLIDLDAQSNLTYVVGADTHRAGAYEVLTLQATAAQATQHMGLVDIIPAGPGLAGADLTITQPGKEYRLRDALRPLAGAYDYCIIDSPPALGILTVNALTAATAAIVTAQADIFSLQAIGALAATLDAIRQHTNPALIVGGILLTRYNPRAILSRDVTDMMQDAAGAIRAHVYAARIRECTALKEAQAMKQDIFTYSGRSNGAADYDAFLDELKGAGI
ncbi:MAG: Chromosome partitioning protein ParA [Firmicutes bacterium ADurb.Bin373]|nr:MAG: Chromosome partitioning protein ParA [Firmicutes bacterium ADurb.Bin373]